MYKVNEFLELLEQFAPLKLSHKMIEKGHYDNSGIIVRHHDYVKSVLFSLDLSLDAVKKAKDLGCDTVVTHHPAIYNPVKTLDVFGDNGAVASALSNGLNVISMHLNLDVAKGGIDDCLCLGLSGKNIKTIDLVDGECGYGKYADISPVSVDEFKKIIENKFESQKILAYGNGNVSKIASFCGGGADQALETIESGSFEVDTVITSDIPHHVLLPLIEHGKNVFVIPHYVAEQFGFNKFYANVSERANGKVDAHYFTDKRFM